MLAHVLHRIRRHWPHVDILVRGDGHYCAPEVLDLLRKMRCSYSLGLSRNKTLDALAAPWREQCQWRWKPSLGRVRRFHQFKYAAESWSQEEKVIARVEATELGTDARFIVTNLTGLGKCLYEKVYCQRGVAENLIKDMKLSTRSDKTACSRWQANRSACSCTWALLAAAFPAHGGAEKVALAPRHVRDDPQRLCEDRRAGGRTEALDQARLPAPSAQRRCTGARHPPPRRARPVNGAARAARTRIDNPQRVRKRPAPDPAVDPADAVRPPPIGFTMSAYGE